MGERLTLQCVSFESVSFESIYGHPFLPFYYAAVVSNRSREKAASTHLPLSAVRGMANANTNRYHAINGSVFPGVDSPTARM
jgi:hypothetical protein